MLVAGPSHGDILVYKGDPVDYTETLQGHLVQMKGLLREYKSYIVPKKGPRHAPEPGRAGGLAGGRLLVPKKSVFTWGSGRGLNNYPDIPVIVTILDGRLNRHGYRLKRDRDFGWMLDGSALQKGIKLENGEFKPVKHLWINQNSSQYAATHKLCVEQKIILAGGQHGLELRPLAKALLDQLDKFPGALTTMAEATADLSGKVHKKELAAQVLYEKLLWPSTATFTPGVEGGRVDITAHDGQVSRKVQLRAVDEGRVRTGHGTGSRTLFHVSDIDVFVFHKLQRNETGRVVGVDFWTVAASELAKFGPHVRGRFYGLHSIHHHSVLIDSGKRNSQCQRRDVAKVAPSITLHSLASVSEHKRFELTEDGWVEVEELPPKKRRRFRDLDRVGAAIPIDLGELDAPE